MYYYFITYHEIVDEMLHCHKQKKIALSVAPYRRIGKISTGSLRFFIFASQLNEAAAKMSGYWLAQRELILCAGLCETLP